MEILSHGGLWIVAGISYAIWLFKGGRRALLFLLCHIAASTILWFSNAFYVPYEMRYDYTERELSALSEKLIGIANETYAKEFVLEDIPQKALEIAGRNTKDIVFSSYPDIMDRWNLSGIFFPVNGKCYLNRNEKTCLLPFVALHELSHREGILNEGQANVDAFLKCMNSDEEIFRYSASIYALSFALNEMKMNNEAEYARLVMSVPDPVRNDLSTINPGRKKNNAPFGNYQDIIPGLLHLQSITSQGVTKETRFVFSVPSPVTNMPATRFSPAFLEENSARSFITVSSFFTKRKRSDMWLSMAM